MSKENIDIDLIVENLISILPVIAKSYSKAVRSKTDFTPSTLFTLGALAHHGKLTMSGIGCHLTVPKPQVTSLVDKLIKDNLVERSYDPNDRRIIYIQLTAKGRETFIETKKIIGAEFRERLVNLEKDKLEVLQTASLNVKTILTEVMQDMFAHQYPNVK